MGIKTEQGRQQQKSKATKEKIYHLPFDQQYDKCSIKLGSGEFYAMTVKEAEEKGFRRAMKWRGK